MLFNYFIQAKFKTELKIVDEDIQDVIVSMEFILEERCLCIIWSSGVILRYDIADEILLPHEYPIVGGADCVAWSPDQEYFVVTSSRANKLTIFNKLFDVIVQHPLNPSEYGSEQLVSVGWGSKETQFHGSLGKSAREKKSENLSILIVDDRKCRISWRGDGQFFAVSSIDRKLNSRVVRIYDREYVLQFTSEVKEGLEHMLSWKPNGDFFAVTQQKFQKHSVSFIEKNGLYFNGFDLPFEFGTVKLKQLSWSIDSKILSVLLEDTKNKKQLLLLYTYGNGHWYLKQVLDFDPSYESIRALVWDPIQVSVLHILTSSYYKRISFTWTVSQSADATVAVVDGKSLLINPFGTCVVPPPMSAYSFDFKNYIRDVSFETNSTLNVHLADSSVIRLSLPSQSPDGDSNNNDIFTVTISDTVGPNRAFAAVNSYTGNIWKDLKVDKFACHLTAVADGFLLVEEENNLCQIVHSSPNGTNRISTDFKAVCAISVDKKINTLAAIEFENGSIYSFNCLTDKLEPWLDEKSEIVKFPQVCSIIAVMDKLVFGLSASYTLYCNNEAVLRNLCTSFTLVKDCFIAYTTTNHQLHVSSIIRPGWRQSLLDEAINPAIPIERGALIVACSPNSGSIVLQPRRGNLEVLYPRTLLWSLVQSMMDEHKFLQAFELMRKHRMDFNLLVDYNLEKFIDNLEEFITQVATKSVDYLVLFVTNLSEEAKAMPVLHQVTEQTNSIKLRTKNNSPSNKMEICTKIFSIVDKIAPKFEELYFMNLILATQVKCQLYDEALKFVKSLDSKRRDEAFQFLFYFFDVNVLFNQALATYDDEIFLMVASKSQKDPKEYNKLRSDLSLIECEAYRRYKIDTLLNQPVKALNNLLQCQGDDYREETLKFIANHRLYKNAISLLSKYQKEHLSQDIWLMYGDYLLGKRYYIEAGIAYNRSGNSDKSMKAYQLAGNWNLALKECIKLQDANALKNLSLAFIHSLSKSGEVVDAAFIAQKYLGDTEKAFRLLISGHEWDHAARMLSQVSQSSSEDFDQLFINGLKDHANSLSELIESENENLVSYCERLLTVRVAKANLQLKREEGNLSDDDMSQVSSIRSSKKSSSSISTSGSSASLKTKKSTVVKEVRQIFKLKKGSRYEDIALVIALKECIDRIQKLQKEVSTLLLHLIERDDLTTASKVRQELMSLLDLVKETITLVWVESLLDTFFIEEKNLPPNIRFPEDLIDIIEKPNFKETSWDLVLLA